jgi:hypothetical protein
MHPARFMGPIDPIDDELGTAENVQPGVQSEESRLIRRVVVDIYPWYNAPAPTAVEVHDRSAPDSEHENQDVPKEPQK